MAYCETAQVKDLLEQVANLQLPGESDLADQITQAQQWIDPVLEAKGYAVPFADGVVPEFIQILVATRAAYLTIRRVNSTGSLDRWMEEFRDDANAMKKDLVRGDVDLPDADIDVDETTRTKLALSNPHGKPKYRYSDSGRRLL